MHGALHFSKHYDLNFRYVVFHLGHVFSGAMPKLKKRREMREKKDFIEKKEKKVGFAIFI